MNSPFKHLSLIWILLSTLFFTMAAAGYTDAVLLFVRKTTTPRAWGANNIADNNNRATASRRHGPRGRSHSVLASTGCAGWTLSTVDMVDITRSGECRDTAEYALQRKLTGRGIPSFEVIFGTKEDREAGRAQEVQLLTIWFGTNDAVLPGRLQYTPIPRFQENLKTLVDYVRNKDSKWYSPNTRIVFINPPPFIAADRLATQYTRWRDEYKCEGPEPVLDREWDNTKKYAEAVVELGKEINVPTIDLWTKIIEAAGGESPEHLKPYF